MKLRNWTIYSMFVRNHGGCFAEAAKDLPRIAALGVDAVWLLPIHPIGRVKRKGTLGSPYAISDYRAVNPEYGTLNDFRAFADAVHGLGMKLLIDVVYNHTSPDSVLAGTHPEWFYHRPDGTLGNRVGDWYDVVDLDYRHPGLWDYQIETLKQWAQLVDGFRCDVAPLVPLDFWLQARREVEAVRPGCIWLAESVEPRFIAELRGRGMNCHSDAELYQAFDVLYDYDVLDDYQAFVRGELTPERYAEALQRQEICYPASYVKLRCLENHDRPRMGFLFPDPQRQRNWLAWCFFQKGAALLYSGQEWAPAHRPGLFDADPIAMDGPAPHAELLQRLIRMKKDPIFAEGVYRILPQPNGLLLAEYRLGERRAVGLFSLRGEAGPVQTELPDGSCRNLIDGAELPVEFGMLCSRGEPIVLLI